MTPTTAYEVLVTNEQAVSIDPDALIAALCRGMAALGVPAEASLSVSLVTPEAIAEIKADAFGEHRSTDVLAFPMDGLEPEGPGPVVFGDLVLCPAVALDQAAAIGVGGEREIVTLLAHGLLHLAGHDHAHPRDEVAMAAAQDTLAAAMREAAA